MSDTLKELHRLLVESLERDDKIEQEIGNLDKNGNSRNASKKKIHVKVNQNQTLDELMTALKFCMLDSIEAIDCVVEADKENEVENPINLVANSPDP